MMETLAQDIRYGLRMLRKSPGFAAMAVITLALGIGANVAIFSYVDELWLRPLPVPHASEVVRIFTSNPSSGGSERGESSYPDFEDLRRDTKTLAGVAAYQGRGAMIDDGVQNKLVLASLISDNFFDVLQPQAAAGRMFTERDLRQSNAPEVVLSYPFWRSQYNGDPGIVGRSIIVDRQNVTVVGVLPRSFRGTEGMAVRDLWIPMSTWQQLRPEKKQLVSRDLRYFDLFGRLKEGVTIQQARTEISGIAAQLASAYPETNGGRKLTLLPESETRGQAIASFGMVLLGIAALVLLIACSNVASLLIARTEYRRHEIATRIALGAKPSRILGQLLVETVLLAMLGTVAALGLGNVLLQALPSLMPQMSFNVGVDAYLSWRGFVVALLIAVCSIFLFGMVPAWLAARTMPAGALKQRGVETGGSRTLARNVLVVGQAALSMVLVVSAALLIRSVWNALALDPGFNAHQQMLVLDFSPDSGGDAQNQIFVKQARQGIESLPGVVGTTVAMRIPFGMSGSGETKKVFVPGSLAGGNREGATINFDPIADRYFDVLGTRLLRGRVIDQHDLATDAHVVVVNQQMAQRFWPNGDAVGKRLRLEKADGDEYEVIGIAENGKYNDFEESAMPYLFIPMKADDFAEVSMAIKTSGDAGAIAAPVRQILRDINPKSTILRLVTLHDHVRQQLYGERVAAEMIAALGGLGLLLAAVGIYGLMSFLVGRRRQEIGIRLALGAQRNEIFRLMINRALLLTSVGVVIGCAGGVAATRLLKTFMVNVGPTDIFAFAIGVAVLLTVAFAAALLPAVSATRVDPMVALRYE
jgi:predicted permease